MPLAHLGIESRHFVAIAVAFHAIVLLVTVRIARRWMRQPPGSLPAFFRTLTRDVSTLLGVALTLGLGSALLMGAFTLARLLGQVLFGELIGLLLWITWMQRRTVQAAAFAAALALALMGAYWEGYRRGPVSLRVERHAVTLSPQAQPGALRILHLTDIQTDTIGRHQQRAIRAGMAEKPDLIVLTGDYVYGARAAADLRALFVRERVNAPLGVYAVQGDLDDDSPATFAGLPVRWLADDAQRIALPGGGHLNLIGLTQGGSRGRTRERLLQLVHGSPAGDVVMVMGHSPDFVRTLVAGDARVDLALAGHTHGGQVVLPFFGPPVTLSRLPRRYAGGLNDYEGMPLHVSRGVGMEGGTAPRVRFLCPPEICVLDVRWPARGLPQFASKAL